MYNHHPQVEEEEEDEVKDEMKDVVKGEVEEVDEIRRWRSGPSCAG